MAGGRSAIAASLALAAAGAVVAAPAPTTGANRDRAGARPNIVVINTDDQTVASLSRRTMPATMRRLARRGTVFTNAIATTPLCCPSRATFLTGQYAHNHGVTWNVPGYSDLRGKHNTLPGWLRRSGYRTAHIGRYLNAYPRRNAPDPGEVPPGWARWQAVVEPFRYFNYELHADGKVRRFGNRARDYLTDIVNRRATRMVRRAAGKRRPLFLLIDQLAPHGSSGESRPPCERAPTPAPRHRRLFAREPLPRPPSLNEADVSDKPSFVRDRPRLTGSQIAAIELRYRCRLASLRAVDDGVRMLHRALRRAGEVRNTAFLLSSDNAFFDGQHRLADAKWLPYEEALRIPLIVRLPRGLAPRSGQPRRVGEQVANVDLAATILHLAAARPCAREGRCRTIDGRSLVGLARGREPAWSRDRRLPLELRNERRVTFSIASCEYSGVRDRRHVFVTHTSATAEGSTRCDPTFEREHYDLRRDPFQLANLYPAPEGSARARTQARLAALAGRLSRCAGVPGRDRPVAGRPFCE